MEKKGKGKPKAPDANNRGEYRSGPVHGTALAAGATFGFKGVQYAEVEGLAVFEGDIVLGRVSEMERAVSDDAGGGQQQPQYGCGITGTDVRWPNCTIPYEVASNLPNKQRITDAIAHWESNTNMKFVLRDSSNQSQYPDYVRFISSSGCWSYVGRRGGMQEIGLASGCSTGNTIHEIGHAVGLWHEQSRADRDTFVRIEWANINPSAQHNFNQHISDGNDYGPYDYGSLMHYSATAFSINGQATIVALQTLPPGVVMGQRNGLSQGDIDAVHAMYPSCPTVKGIPKDPIKEIRKEIVKDPIKEIRKELLKDHIKEIRKELLKDPIRDPIIKRPGENIFKLPITPIQPWKRQPGVTVRPFITGIPSRAPQEYGDPLSETTAQVQQLYEALIAAEQEYAQIAAAYEEAVQYLQSLGGGQV